MKRGLLPVLLAACAALGNPSCGSAGSGDGGAAPVLTLSILPRQPSFALGDAVILDVTITNASNGSLAVSRFLQGVLRVKAFERDGMPVPPAVAEVRLEEGLAQMTGAGLVTLAPGAQVTVPFESEFLGLARGQSFSLYAEDAAGVPSIQKLTLNQVGAYELRATYRFDGANPLSLPATLVESGEATAKFDIVP